MSVPLYELTAQLREVQDLATHDDIPAEAILNALEVIEGDIKVKATNIAALTRNLEASAAMIREAGKRMLERADRLERRSESIKAYLLWNCQAAQITKIECPEYVISVRKNPPAVIIDDENKIPPEFIFTPMPEPRPDKVKIKAALKAGEDVPGAHLFQNERLEIKE
jgi:hypothetical protein